MRGIAMGCLLALVALTCVACADDNPVPPASDVVDDSLAAGSVDTLMLLVTARLNPDNEELGELAGLYLDPVHLLRLELFVDNERWGEFAPVPSDAPPPDPSTVHQGWKLDREPRRALLIAKLGRNLDDEEPPMETVADWVDFLRRHLEAGDHVAEIRTLQLESDEGEALELVPSELLPFEVAPGDRTALVGEWSLTIDELGGAR